MNQYLELEKLQDIVDGKKKPIFYIGILMMAFLFFNVISFPALMFMGAIYYFISKKKKQKAAIETREMPRSYKDFMRGQSKSSKSKSPIDAKLQKAVLLTKKKKNELEQKRRVLMAELENLNVVSSQDEQYAQALRSGLTILRKQISKVEESYAHLELSVYNKQYQELLKLVKTKKVKKNFNKVNKDLGRLLTRLQNDVIKYDNIRHPRAIDEYNALIDDISAFRGRMEQVRRKEVLDDISMTGVYDEDRNNSKSFDKMKDLYSNLEADKSIRIAMDELEELEDEMQRLNAESEVLRRYGDTL